MLTSAIELYKISNCALYKKFTSKFLNLRINVNGSRILYKIELTNAAQTASPALILTMLILFEVTFDRFLNPTGEFNFSYNIL